MVLPINFALLRQDRYNGMNLKTRWHNLFKEFWGNKTRLLLALLWIALSIGGVGIAANAFYLINTDLFTQFTNGNPASVSLELSPFDETLAAEVAVNQLVGSAAPRRMVMSSLADDPSSALQLEAVPDFEHLRVSQPLIIAGRHALGFAAIALEADTAEVLEMQVGDLVLVQMASGKVFSLKVQAIVQDVYEQPITRTGLMLGYINAKTLSLLGEPQLYNRLDVVIKDDHNDAGMVIQAVNNLKASVLEPAGVKVIGMQYPGGAAAPGGHWAQKQIILVLAVLLVAGVLTAAISVWQVIDTVRLVVPQQIKQIEDIPPLREDPFQKFILDLLVFSLVGWVLAILIGIAGSYGLAQIAAKAFHFTVAGVRVAPLVFLLQTVLAFVVPVAVALYPLRDLSKADSLASRS